MELSGMLTSVLIASVLAALTPFITARAKVKIDAENIKRSVKRIENDPIINVGSFFERINFPGKDSHIGPCYVSQITDTYIQIIEWETGCVTSFEGNEFASVQYWGLPVSGHKRKSRRVICNIAYDRKYIEERFGKPGPKSITV